MRHVVALLVILLVVSSDVACNTRTSIRLGASVVTEDSREYWNTGVIGGISVLYYSTPNLAYGLGVGLGVHGTSNSVEDIGLEGRLFTVEAMPVLRFQTDRKDGLPLNIYIQVAAGVMIVDATYTSWPPPQALSSFSINESSSSKAFNSEVFGMNLGIGIISITSGKVRYDLLLQYHFEFSDPVADKFITLSLGIMFGN